MRSLSHQVGVPELWRYENRQLQIYVLRPDGYVQSPVSPTFSSLATLRETIERFVVQSKIDGASTALRVFRAWVKAQIASSENFLDRSLDISGN